MPHVYNSGPVCRCVASPHITCELAVGFYFIAPRGGKKEMRQQGDAALDEAMDETDLLEY